MSVYISNLPLYTGNTYNGYIIWNDSGETTTYKTLYQPPFKVVGTNNRIINAWDSASSVAGDNSMILGGIGNSIPSGNRNIIINGENATNNGSANCAIIGGLGGNITDGFGNGIFAGSGVVGGNWSAQVGGYDNTIGGVFNDRCFIGGGGNNTIGNSANSALIAAYGNTLTSGYEIFIAGTESNTLTAAGYTFALIGGGYNTVNNTGQSAGNAMYSSYFCSDTTTNDTSVIGSSNNWFAGSRNCSQTGYGKHNWITNSYNSSITNSVVDDTNTQWFNKIDSSSGSTITTSKKSQIIGGQTNTILNKENVVMVGTSGRTASADYTTYVENIHTYRTPSTRVQPISSGTTFTCNLNNGGKSQFYITGTNTINITNVRDGASFMIKTQTDGNYVTTWTASGYTFVFEGGIKDPGNNVTDIFVFEVFGSVIYGNRRHNYS